MAKVLGVELYNKNLSSAVSDVISLCVQNNKQKENRCVSASGAHGLVYSERQKAYKNLLNDFYINLPDGMPGVWIGRLKGENLMKRCYGPDFFKILMKESAGKNIHHFLCGGKEGVAEELKKECGIKFNNNAIVGTFCPPFKKMTDDEVNALAKIINKVGANIVWIGLGTPKQEYFAAKLKQYTNVDFIITVGAAFDFHTGRLKQAPSWVQQMGLEWLFRLYTEPRRLYKRYFKIVPLFIFYNLKELAHFCFLKIKKTI